ncbi:hypothetical protein C8Q78DRAFT_699691 [Trametes maxima]|nr:hypothetical protein C8Q78DRAFT_699691 [Trametes maxima]
MVRLLDLPDELLVSILVAADPHDLLICRRVCRTLARVLHATELQYKTELGTAGMVDGPPSETTVPARLAALRAYRAAWTDGAHPLHPVPRSFWSTTRRVSHFGPVTLFWAADEGVLKAYSPPAAFCGVPGRGSESAQCEVQVRRDVSGSGWASWSTPRRHCVALDTAQGALVLLISTSRRDRPDVMLPAIRVMNLLDPSVPHPLSTMSGDTTLPPIIDADRFPRPHSVQMVGDSLVLWSAEGGGAWSLDYGSLYVVQDWKTGAIVWRMVAERGMDAVLISPTRLVVVDPTPKNQMLFHVFRLDPTLAVPPALVSAEDSLFTLCMPPLQERTTYEGRTRTFFQYPHAPLPGSTLLFQRDPALSILAVQMDVSRTEDEHEHEHHADEIEKDSERYVVCIPLPTLFADYGNARTRAHTDVPWERWGPRGARIFKLAPRAKITSVVGAQCVVGSSELRDIYVLEVFPLADKGADGRELVGALDSSAVHVEAPDVFDERNSFAWEGAVRSTYPFSITRRKVAQWHRSILEVALGRDGLLLDTRRGAYRRLHVCVRA